MTLYPDKKVLLKLEGRRKKDYSYLDNKIVTLKCANSCGDGWYIQEAISWFWNHEFYPVPEKKCRCKKPDIIVRELLGQTVEICKKCNRPRKIKKNV